jgi:hypothetical protein
MTKRTSRSVFDGLKSFRTAEVGAVKKHAKIVRDTLMPRLKNQLQSKEQAAAKKAKSFKVF